MIEGARGSSKRRVRLLELLELLLKVPRGHQNGVVKICKNSVTRVRFHKFVIPFLQDCCDGEAQSTTEQREEIG